MVRARARTRRMQATVGRPWLGRACGLEHATLIEPHLPSLSLSLAFSSNRRRVKDRFSFLLSTNNLSELGSIGTIRSQTTLHPRRGIISVRINPIFEHDPFERGRERK